MESLRVLQPGDLDQAAEVYRDAVISQSQGLYSPGQIEAWSNHAHNSNALAEALSRGHGLASCAENDSNRIEAFGVLDPIYRLSLLYCRGNSSRQGRSSAILRALEHHAWQQGCRHLHTEASQLSKPLLLRLGWQIEAEETVIFAGETFQRWRMIKNLCQPQKGMENPPGETISG
ncbi:MAG: GNAT family N-acetyltransferase [Cyanobium sp.]